MSLSLIAFQPAIELPSNMKPSVRLSSSTTPEAMVRCCHLPLGSVKRRSTQSISSSLILDRIVPASVGFAIVYSPLSSRERGTVDLKARQTPSGTRRCRGSDGQVDSSLGVQIPDLAPRVRRGVRISQA